MAPKDGALLCLVLCLGQRIHTQEEGFPVPTVSATPSPVVPWNGFVRILCRGTPEAFLYQLLFLENATHKVIEKKLGFQREAEFIINPMNTTTAGYYQCQYRKQYRWSEESEALQLVVTGLYDKPLLSPDQGHMLMPGENISLQCGSTHVLFDRFSLVKEGETSWTQHQHNGTQANFTLGPVNPSFTGYYRCYGWHSSSPHVWSAPSDALELVIAEKPDYAVENWVRMGVAGLVLLALLGILAENRYSHRAQSKEAWQDVAAPGWSTQKCQV